MTNVVKLCQHFKVLYRTENPEGSDCGVIIQWEDEKGKIHMLRLGVADMRDSGERLYPELIKRGFRIEDENYMQCIVQYIQKEARNKPTIECISLWHPQKER